MGWLSGIAGTISALVSGWGAIMQAFNLLREAYKAWSKMKHEQNVNRTVDAINNGDTIGVERGIGNPDAGKPSGIGQVREKKPK